MNFLCLDCISPIWLQVSVSTGGTVRKCALLYMWLASINKVKKNELYTFKLTVHQAWSLEGGEAERNDVEWWLWHISTLINREKLLLWLSRNLKGEDFSSFANLCRQTVANLKPRLPNHLNFFAQPPDTTKSGDFPSMHLQINAPC